MVNRTAFLISITRWKFWFDAVIMRQEVREMYNIRRYVVGLVQENCYFISNKDKETLIIDPGDQGQLLVKELRKNKLKPVAILLTHAHFDHIGAADVIREAFDIPLYVHEKEAAWLQNPALNGSGKYREIPPVTVNEAEVLISKEGNLTVGPFSFDVRHTPGHSPGSVSYVFEQQGFAIVGDTLFKGSIGRTDLIEGNMNVLVQAIDKHLLSLDEDTLIYPGHGESTTVDEEMENNPFLNGF